MIRKLLFILVLIFFPLICLSDEYVLVMSKNDKVCQHMLKTYNEDMKKYGEIKYDQHEEFTEVEWEDKKYYRLYEGKKEYPTKPYDSSTTVLISTFDINNDGKKEIVIKDEVNTFKGINSDALYFFKEKDSEYFKDDINITVLNMAPGKLMTIFDSYKLKELPQFLYLGIGDKESKAYYSLNIYTYINPFFFDGNYYLSINDEVPYDTNKIYSSNFLVILKFTKDNQPKDVCYFIKTTNCKKKPKRG